MTSKKIVLFSRRMIAAILSLSLMLPSPAYAMRRASTMAPAGSPEIRSELRKDLAALGVETQPARIAQSALRRSQIEESQITRPSAASARAEVRSENLEVVLAAIERIKTSEGALLLAEALKTDFVAFSVTRTPDAAGDLESAFRQPLPQIEAALKTLSTRRLPVIGTSQKQKALAQTLSKAMALATEERIQALHQRTAENLKAIDAVSEASIKLLAFISEHPNRGVSQFLLRILDGLEQRQAQFSLNAQEQGYVEILKQALGVGSFQDIAVVIQYTNNNQFTPGLLRTNLEMVIGRSEVRVTKDSHGAWGIEHSAKSFDSAQDDGEPVEPRIAPIEQSRFTKSPVTSARSEVRTKTNDSGFPACIISLLGQQVELRVASRSTDDFTLSILVNGAYFGSYKVLARNNIVYGRYWEEEPIAEEDSLGLRSEIERLFKEMQQSDFAASLKAKGAETIRYGTSEKEVHAKPIFDSFVEGFRTLAISINPITHERAYEIELTNSAQVAQLGIRRISIDAYGLVRISLVGETRSNDERIRFYASSLSVFGPRGHYHYYGFAPILELIGVNAQNQIRIVLKDRILRHHAKQPGVTPLPDLFISDLSPEAKSLKPLLKGEVFLELNRIRATTLIIRNQAENPVPTGEPPVTSARAEVREEKSKVHRLQTTVLNPRNVPARRRTAGGDRGLWTGSAERSEVRGNSIADEAVPQPAETADYSVAIYHQRSQYPKEDKSKLWTTQIDAFGSKTAVTGMVYKITFNNGLILKMDESTQKRFREGGSLVPHQGILFHIKDSSGNTLHTITLSLNKQLHVQRQAWSHVAHSKVNRILDWMTFEVAVDQLSPWTIENRVLHDYGAPGLSYDRSLQTKTHIAASYWHVGVQSFQAHRVVVFDKRTMRAVYETEYRDYGVNGKSPRFALTPDFFILEKQRDIHGDNHFRELEVYKIKTGEKRSFLLMADFHGNTQWKIEDGDLILHEMVNTNMFKTLGPEGKQRRIPLASLKVRSEVRTENLVGSRKWEVGSNVQHPTSLHPTFSNRSALTAVRGEDSRAETRATISEFARLPARQGMQNAESVQSALKNPQSEMQRRSEVRGRGANRDAVFSLDMPHFKLLLAAILFRNGGDPATTLAVPTNTFPMPEIHEIFINTKTVKAAFEQVVDRVPFDEDSLVEAVHHFAFSDPSKTAAALREMLQHERYARVGKLYGEDFHQIAEEIIQIIQTRSEMRETLEEAFAKNTPSKEIYLQLAERAGIPKEKAEYRYWVVEAAAEIARYVGLSTTAHELLLRTAAVRDFGRRQEDSNEAQFNATKAKLKTLGPKFPLKADELQAAADQYNRTSEQPALDRLEYARMMVSQERSAGSLKDWDAKDDQVLGEVAAHEFETIRILEEELNRDLSSDEARIILAHHWFRFLGEDKPQSVSLEELQWVTAILRLSLVLDTSIREHNRSLEKLEEFFVKSVAGVEGIPDSIRDKVLAAFHATLLAENGKWYQEFLRPAYPKNLDSSILDANDAFLKNLSARSEVRLPANELVAGTENLVGRRTLEVGGNVQRPHILTSSLSAFWAGANDTESIQKKLERVWFAVAVSVTLTAAGFFMLSQGISWVMIARLGISSLAFIASGYLYANRIDKIAALRFAKEEAEKLASRVAHLRAQLQQIMGVSENAEDLKNISPDIANILRYAQYLDEQLAQKPSLERMDEANLFYRRHHKKMHPPQSRTSIKKMDRERLIKKWLPSMTPNEALTQDDHSKGVTAVKIHKKFEAYAKRYKGIAPSLDTVREDLKRLMEAQAKATEPSQDGAIQRRRIGRSYRYSIHKPVARETPIQGVPHAVNGKRAHSTDGSKTWDVGRDSQLPTPLHPTFSNRAEVRALVQPRIKHDLATQVVGKAAVEAIAALIALRTEGKLDAGFQFEPPATNGERGILISHPKTGRKLFAKIDDPQDMFEVMEIVSQADDFEVLARAAAAVLNARSEVRGLEVAGIEAFSLKTKASGLVYKITFTNGMALEMDSDTFVRLKVNPNTVSLTMIVFYIVYPDEMMDRPRVGIYLDDQLRISDWRMDDTPDGEMRKVLDWVKAWLQVRVQSKTQWTKKGFSGLIAQTAFSFSLESDDWLRLSKDIIFKAGEGPALSVDARGKMVTLNGKHFGLAAVTAKPGMKFVIKDDPNTIRWIAEVQSVDDALGTVQLKVTPQDRTQPFLDDPQFFSALLDRIPEQRKHKVHARNVLTNLGIRTLRPYLEHSQKELLQYSQLGKKTLQVLEETLAASNIDRSLVHRSEVRQAPLPGETDGSPAKEAAQEGVMRSIRSEIRAKGLDLDGPWSQVAIQSSRTRTMLDNASLHFIRDILRKIEMEPISFTKYRNFGVTGMVDVLKALWDDQLIVLAPHFSLESFSGYPAFLDLLRKKGIQSREDLMNQLRTLPKSNQWVRRAVSDLFVARYIQINKTNEKINQLASQWQNEVKTKVHGLDAKPVPHPVEQALTEVFQNRHQEVTKYLIDAIQAEGAGRSFQPKQFKVESEKLYQVQLSMEPSALEKSILSPARFIIQMQKIGGLGFDAKEVEEIKKWEFQFRLRNTLERAIPEPYMPGYLQMQKKSENSFVVKIPFGGPGLGRNGLNPVIDIRKFPPMRSEVRKLLFQQGEKLRGTENGNPMVRMQDEQVLIPGDNRVGMSSHRTFQDRVVFRVPAVRNAVNGVHPQGSIMNHGKELSSLGSGNQMSPFGAARNVQQFFEQDAGRQERKTAVKKSEKNGANSRAAQEGAQENVSIDYGAHKNPGGQDPRTSGHAARGVDFPGRVHPSLQAAGGTAGATSSFAIDAAGTSLPQEGAGQAIVRPVSLKVSRQVFSSSSPLAEPKNTLPAGLSQAPAHRSEVRTEKTTAGRLQMADSTTVSELPSGTRSEVRAEFPFTLVKNNWVRLEKEIIFEHNEQNIFSIRAPQHVVTLNGKTESPRELERIKAEPGMQIEIKDFEGKKTQWIITVEATHAALGWIRFKAILQDNPDPRLDDPEYFSSLLDGLPKGFNVRAYHVLTNLGILTLRPYLEHSPRQLLDYRNLGKKTLHAVETMLTANELSRDLILTPRSETWTESLVGSNVQHHAYFASPEQKFGFAEASRQAGLTSDVPRSSRSELRMTDAAKAKILYEALSIGKGSEDQHHSREEFFEKAHFVEMYADRILDQVTLPLPPRWKTPNKANIIIWDSKRRLNREHDSQVADTHLVLTLNLSAQTLLLKVVKGEKIRSKTFELSEPLQRILPGFRELLTQLAAKIQVRFIDKTPTPFEVRADDDRGEMAMLAAVFTGHQARMAGASEKEVRQVERRTLERLQSQGERRPTRKAKAEISRTNSSAPVKGRMRSELRFRVAEKLAVSPADVLILTPGMISGGEAAMVPEFMQTRTVAIAPTQAHRAGINKINAVYRSEARRIIPVSSVEEAVVQARKEVERLHLMGVSKRSEIRALATADDSLDITAALLKQGIRVIAVVQYRLDQIVSSFGSAMEALIRQIRSDFAASVSA